MADVRDGIPSDMYQKWERASDKSTLVKTRAELLRTDNMVLTDPPQAEIVKKHKSQHRARYFLSGAGFCCTDHAVSWRSCFYAPI